MINYNGGAPLLSETHTKWSLSLVNLLPQSQAIGHSASLEPHQARDEAHDTDPTLTHTYR